MQKVMFYTKDNRIIVAEVDFSGYTQARKRAELQRMQHYFAQYDYAEICHNYSGRNAKPAAEKKILSLMDGNNTSFVNLYVKGYNYAKNRAGYKNNVGANNFPPAVMKPNTLHFDYSLADSAVPEFIKNLGFKIIPEEVTKDVNVDDPNFADFWQNMSRMSVTPEDRHVRIYRYHYTFPPADYVRLRRLITDYNSRSPKPDVNAYCAQIRDVRERKLFNIYAHELASISDQLVFAHHEFHHVKNRMIFQAMMCKPDVKRLTAENTYRLEVENERSAYLSQMIESINRYLEGGNFDDYSMFDNFSQGIVARLKAMPNTQKTAYLTDMDKIVNEALKQFESKKRKYYDEHQFIDGTRFALLAQPMDVPEDLNGEQYRLMRSAYYSISVYNPATGRMETRNLSKYIKPENEVQINAEQMREIVEPAKSSLETSLQDFETYCKDTDIDVGLLEEARAFYRKQMRNPRIIADASTINVADLVDGKPQPDEHNPSPTPPAPIPDDKADWSDELKQYWSRFDGYNELAKNNLEYRFSIKNQEVSYTSKDKVSLGKTCGYEMYDRLVKEPSGAKKAIRFENTLSNEQALMLYVACVNNGRKMRGAIPRDLTAIETMTSIPKAERDKFKSLTTPPASHSISVAKPFTRQHFHTREYSSLSNK